MYTVVWCGMIWCGWSATPGYSSSWMTRREQSCGLPTIVLYDMVRCGLPTTNLVKLTTHLPSPTIIIVALKRFNLLSCLDSCSFITSYLTASILMSCSLCPAQHAKCIVYPPQICSICCSTVKPPFCEHCDVQSPDNVGSPSTQTTFH